MMFAIRYRKAISCHYASGQCTFSRLPEHASSLLSELLETAAKPKGNIARRIMAALSDDERTEIYQYAFRKKSRRITGNCDFDWEITPEVQERYNQIVARALQAME